jgi:hypothetical protein
MADWWDTSFLNPMNNIGNNSLLGQPTGGLFNNGNQFSMNYLQQPQPFQMGNQYLQPNQGLGQFNTPNANIMDSLAANMNYLDGQGGWSDKIGGFFDTHRSSIGAGLGLGQLVLSLAGYLGSRDDADRAFKLYGQDRQDRMTGYNNDLSMTLAGYADQQVARQAYGGGGGLYESPEEYNKKLNLRYLS